MKKAILNQPGENHTLGTQSIPGLVLHFAATTLTALVLNSVYTLTDALFVSWGVGDNAMGGVSVVYPFVILQGAISTAVGGGAASIVSRKLGAGKPEEAGNVTLHAMAAFYTSAVAITVLGFLFMQPLLQWMGVTPELYSHAKSYFSVILAVNVLSTGFSSIIRAEGKMTYGLLIWAIPITINIILDAVFILGMGYGVLGSALATAVSQLIGFFMCVLFFTRFTTQRFRGFRLRLRTIGEILAIGLPSLVQMGSLSVMSMVLNNVLRGAAGTLGVNTFAYISKLITFAIVPITALTQALAPIVGYNYGAGKRGRVRQTVTFCLALSMCYAVLALGITLAFPRQLIGIFTNNPQLIQSGARGLSIIALSLLFMPLPMLVGAVFQAVGQKMWALLLYAANVLCFLPLALVLLPLLGMDGIWWAYTLASILSACLAVVQMLRRKHSRYFSFLLRDKASLP